MSQLECSIPFNPALYVTPRRIDARHAVVVAQQVQICAPADLGGGARAKLLLVASTREALMNVLKDRAKSSPGGMRPVLANVDNAWGGLHGRCESAARMPSGGLLAQEGQQLLDTVFGNEGLSFLRADAEAKHTESEKRLAIIAEGGLAARLDAVAGAGFLDEVRTAHAALGEALGLGSTPLTYGPTALADALSDVRLAIALYALQVAAEVDPSSEDSVRRFYSAMVPLDRLAADRASSDDGSADPAASTPSTTAPSATAPSTTAPSTTTHA